MNYLDRVAKRYLAPCPVCGKLPNLKRDYACEESINKVCVASICKQFMQPLHIKVECVGDSIESAVSACISEYNMTARQFLVY